MIGIRIPVNSNCGTHYGVLSSYYCLHQNTVAQRCTYFDFHSIAYSGSDFDWQSDFDFDFDCYSDFDFDFDRYSDFDFDC